MREENFVQNVLLVIYSIPESLLKSDLLFVINPYSINKKVKSGPMQKKKKLKRENDIKIGKKKGLSHSNFSSLIIISPKTIYKLIKLTSFLSVGPKLINKFPS